MIITFHLYPPLPSSVPREHHIKSSTVISVSPSIKIHVLATILSTVFSSVRSCHLVTLGGRGSTGLVMWWLLTLPSTQG